MDNILVNLSIISKIGLGDKIYVNNEGFIAIENNTIFQSVFRFVYRNSRAKTINNLTNFYSGVFSYIDNALPLSGHYISKDKGGKSDKGNPFESSGCELQKIRVSEKDYSLKTLLLYLNKSIPGLENLRETYSSDIVMTSKLDIVLDNVRLYSNKLDNKLKKIDKDIV